METTFGEFLKQKRQEQNLTQKELADLLFVSSSAVSKWEKDIAHPDISLLPKLSEILGVTEHELITASVDLQYRKEKSQAKKWRAFSFSWSLFFYIAYIVALIPCFICNLAINKTLSWFWIVLSALLLAFSFTNLPKLIRKNKLILLPLCNYLSLVILLGVCCLYTQGNWFLIPVLSVLLGLSIIFTPIYICRCKIFAKLKKYADFITTAIVFIILNILLIVIYILNNNNTYNNLWYIKIALPICLGVYLFLNLLLSVRFLKINRFLKTSLILSIINLIFGITPMFLKVKNVAFQKEIDQANILNANFSKWIPEQTLESNISLIVFLTLIFLAIVFLAVGLVRYFKLKNKK